MKGIQLYNIEVKTPVELVLEKGRKPLPEGTIREWQGKRFKKTTQGWVPEGERKGRGRPKKN